jgi:hypothetical protein
MANEGGKTMTKLIAILAGGLLLGAGVASVQLLGSSSPARAAGTTTGSTETVTVTTPASVATTAAAVDVPGPCDEAEHATDPRCTGAGAAAADDDDRAAPDHRGGHHGRGGDDDRHGDDHDDRSGSNSGRG